jgi:hypothetical protein
MSGKLTPVEIEAQWQAWSAKHPNPSGLPTNSPLLKGQTPDKIHSEVMSFSTFVGDLKVSLPAIRWVGSPNFSPNRDGHNPEWTAADPTTWIVLHTMDGYMTATIAAFGSVARQASSHYGIGLDGSIVQFVKESDAAWTNGTYANDPGSNLDSITIEHEDGGDYNGPRTAALYETSAQLVADISKRRGIPLIHRGTGGGVLGHKECNGASTACPDGLDIARIIARAIEITNGVNPVVTPPSVSVVKPSTPVAGAVFDTPTNDRSYMDYPSATFVMGKIADIGATITWDESKLITNPATGASEWLDRVTGTNFGLLDQCIDDGGLDPPHFAPVVPPVVPPVVVPPIVPPVVVPPVVTPPVVPPVIVPPVVPPVIVPPIVDPTPINLWDAIVAFFRKWFTGK